MKIMRIHDQAKATIAVFALFVLIPQSTFAATPSPKPKAPTKEEIAAAQTAENAKAQAAAAAQQKLSSATNVLQKLICNKFPR